MSDYDALLNSEGIAHTTGTPTLMPHRWDSGWVPIALAALSQDSQNLRRPRNARGRCETPYGPVLGAIRPASTRRSVVLPPPFGPTRRTRPA